MTSLVGFILQEKGFSVFEFIPFTIALSIAPFLDKEGVKSE